jgi:hypothetical protein
MVAAAKTFSDIGQRTTGEFAGEKHGDLPRTRDLAGAERRLHFAQIELVELRRLLLDFLDGDAAIAGGGVAALRQSPP